MAQPAYALRPFAQSRLKPE